MPIIRQFKGILPALDVRQVTEKLVLDGQNFLVDAQGPFSAFGSELVTFEHIENPELAKTFRVGAEIFLFTTTAVLKYNSTSGVFFPIYIFPTVLNSPYPWYRATVGGVHYFVKFGSEVISYNTFTKKWITVTAFAPVNPYFVAQSGGRLIIMGADVLGWSAIDNGFDLETDVDKGSGQQSLAVAGGGIPLGLLATWDGFIAYTTTGSLKAETVQSLSPFRVFSLTGDDDHIPLSAWNIINLGKNEHVMLTKTGFYVTNGKVPEIYQPLHSEYFRRSVLPNFDLSNPAAFKLTYYSDKEWFIVSIAESEQQFKFSIAHVLYLPRDEWGLFNRNHSSFGELSLVDGPFKGFNFGYFCFDGCLHKFSDFPRVEQHPRTEINDKLPGNAWQYHTSYEIPARYQDGIAYMSSVIHMSTFDESVFSGVSGLYTYVKGASNISPTTPNDGIATATLASVSLLGSSIIMQAGLSQDIWSTYARVYGSIDAWVKLGLWSGKTEQDKSDEMSLVTELNIGMQQAPSGQEFVDWLLVSPDITVDWLTDNSGDEDWGEGVFSGTNYFANIIGSLDGENVFQDQQQVLEEREGIVDDDALENTGKVKYFTCYNNGFYHIIEITAQELEQSFHVKTVDMPLVSVGRL